MESTTEFFFEETVDGFFLKNASENVTLTENSANFPLWALMFYIVILCTGCCLNLLFSLVLLNSRRNGILDIILQLAITDAASIFNSAVEIWSLTSENWIFSPTLCSFFSGFEVLISNLIKYLLICLNFHVISLWNLHVFEKQKTSKNPLTSYSDNESNECLVTKAENSNSRNVTIDYRRRQNDVSVLLPTSLAWFFCISLCIPEFALSSTLKAENNFSLCTVIDVYYGPLLQNLLLVFRVILPVPLLLITVFALFVKLCQNKCEETEIENVLNKKTYKIENLIIFTVCMSLCYALLSSQREIFYFMHVFSRKYDSDNIETFMVPPLHNLYLSGYCNILLSISNYSASVLRPILYIYLLPKFKFLVKSKVICVEKKKSVT